MYVFSEEDIVASRAPHIGRAWFLELLLDSGTRYVHNGIGRVNVGGHQWEGINNPGTGQLVSMTKISEPRFGQAASITVTISGASREFFKAMYDQRASIEGTRANVYFATFDPETNQTIIGLKRMFPAFVSAPEFMAVGIGVRAIAVTIESYFQWMNFATGEMWSDADFRARYNGAKGLMYLGTKIKEQWA